MSRKCDICGKQPSYGNQITRRGKAKKQGGVGKKVTGISRRRWLPNLHDVRVREGRSVRRLRVCTSCLKAGKVVKAV